MRIKWFSVVRIVGLVFVLSYHFFKNIFPGGFIGVDIFFTFSGFLITALMVDEFGKNSHFDLRAFYRRRLYRIFPPLVLAVLFTLPFTLLISRDFITAVGKQIAAALGFTTNFFEILTGGSYESKFIPHLFVHTWSLAVEMHFYLLWGLAAFLISRHVEKKAVSTERQLPIFRSRLFLLALLFFLISFLAMLLGTIGLKEFSPIYFSSLTHSFPFFLGSMVGVMTGIKETPKAFKKRSESWSARRALIVMSAAFVLLLALVFVLTFTGLVTYLFGLLLASILAAVMIYGARILHDKTPNLTEPRGITFFADTSYGVYLFHWPLYIVFSHLFHSVAAAVCTTLFSIFFAALSYYYIEPLIAGKKVTFRGFDLRQKLSVIPLASVGAILAAGTLFIALTAPKLSNLEEQLWSGSLYQDVSALELTRDQADAAAATSYAVPKGVSIIGDSVTLGTSKYLSEHVTDSRIDAKGNRTMDLAYQVMLDQQKKNVLREYVVICIGTNALADYKEQTMNIINSLKAGHRLIFMTPHDGSADATYNSTKLGIWEQTLPAAYDYITIADWNKAASANPDIFAGSDGTHFAGNDKGDQLYAQTVNDALKAAAAKPAKTNLEASQKKS